MLAFYAEEGLLGKNESGVLIVIVRGVIRTAETVLSQGSCVDGVVGDAEQNGGFKLDVPIVVFVLLREAEADDGSGIAIEVVAAGGRLKPVPNFVAFPDAAGKGDAAELDGLRVRLLRLGYCAKQKNQETEEEAFHGVSSPQGFQTARLRAAWGAIRRKYAQ